MDEEAKKVFDALIDIAAASIANEMADYIIDSLNSSLTDGVSALRKPLVYIKIIDRLQRELEALSGEVKVEE